MVVNRIKGLMGKEEEQTIPAVLKIRGWRAYGLQVLMVLLAIVYFIPFYWMIVKSFRSSIFAGFPVNLNPVSGTSIHNFVSNLNQVWVSSLGALPVWYMNSVFIAVTVVAGSVLVGAMAGYAFARLRFRGRDILFILVLATLMIPFPVITIAEYVFMVDIGWVNTYQSLILPQIASAVNVFLFRQFFLTIPVEVEEAAKLDGLKPISIFFRIASPLAMPAYAASAILTFMGSWNNFIWPAFDIKSVNMFTLPLALNFFKGANGTAIYWNQMMTFTILSLIPTFVMYLVFERYFVSGLGAISGLKG